MVIDKNIKWSGHCQGTKRADQFKTTQVLSYPLKISHRNPSSEIFCNSSSSAFYEGVYASKQGLSEKQSEIITGM